MSYLLPRQLSHLTKIAIGTLIAVEPIAIVAIAMVSIVMENMQRADSSC